MNTKLNYYFDTEFNEDFIKPWFGRKRHFIDLISIGIVCEDGRTYYAISKDFDLKAAWNKYQIEFDGGKPMQHAYVKVYWLRENVLRPIFNELAKDLHGEHYDDQEIFDYTTMAALVNLYGKSNKQIAEEITDFCRPNSKKARALDVMVIEPIDHPIFWGYFADYDWVVLCSLFGTMMNLPRGFPMYCRDLKQMLDEKVNALKWYYGRDVWSNTRKEGDTELAKGDRLATFEEKLNKIKNDASIGYPKQENEHNALDDAQWDVKLHSFIKNSFPVVAPEICTKE